jgi:hypothetical protein
MGPLVLGQPRREILRILREQGLEFESDGDDDEDSELFVEAMDSHLVFSSDEPKRLTRMDIDDDRLRFGPMQVHGKRLHEIVDLFQVPSSETLWCNHYEDDVVGETAKRLARTYSDRELIESGTLWITTLGLGLTVYLGEIETVHLCDPEHVPHFGSGQWTQEQRVLSETYQVKDEVPKQRIDPPKRRRLAGVILLVGFVMAMGCLVWQAMALQAQWNNAQETRATVVSVNPPPPAAFPDEYTLSYRDNLDAPHQVVYRSNQILGLPAVGDEVTLRFLVESPDKPLLEHQSRDVGFDFAMPYGIAILATYWILNLVVTVVPAIISRR